MIAKSARPDLTDVIIFVEKHEQHYILLMVSSGFACQTAEYRYGNINGYEDK